MQNAILSEYGIQKENNRIVIVTGMHRSGTSLCAQILNMMGIDIAYEVGVNRGNEKGHYERWDIVEIHDEILNNYNRSYFSNLHDLPMPPGWWGDFELRKYKEKLKNIITPLIGERKIFGFKDPRTTKLMPLWNSILLELEVNPKFIICLRNPAHIALSLNIRDNLEIKTGEIRTLEYMVDAFRYTTGRDRAVIIYDDWFTDRNKNFSKLTRLLGERLTIESVDAEIGLRTIIAPEMNRSALPNARINQQIVEYFYQLALDYEKNAGAGADVSNELDMFVKHYTYFKHQASPIGAYVERLTADKAAAEGEVSVQTAHLAEAQARIHDLCEHTRRLEAECEHLRHQVQEMATKIAPPANPEPVVVPAASLPVSEVHKTAMELPIPAEPISVLSAEGPAPPTETHSPPADAPVSASDDVLPFADASSTGPDHDPTLRDPIAPTDQAPTAQEASPPAG